MPNKRQKQTRWEDEEIHQKEKENKQAVGVEYDKIYDYKFVGSTLLRREEGKFARCDIQKCTHIDVHAF